MRILTIIAIMMLFSTITVGVDATSGTNVNTVQFVQYLDENTALEEVRNGNLDMYYYRISSDRIENSQSKEDLKIFESTGGSYSILVNPAESEKFNPFSIKDIRFALNYLVDRKLVVNELMGGYGVPMISNYGPFDPEFLTILNELEEFQFRYNPEFANQLISNSMKEHGALKINDVWTYDNEPVKITVFIRSDDPVRKSIGEILVSELEMIGFKVVKDFGDLNKAFVVVYGSNPADLKWNIYTEGWAGRSAFVRYDPIGLAQMYSPWYSNMPGFNDPNYWNYENQYLDELTQRIYTGNFTSAEQRNELIQKSTTNAINEAVRIFLASKIDQYVVNENVNGVINDFGAGVPTRFTPINAHGKDDSLVIGVKQIYQGAWNPVRGLTDSYSTQIWHTINDPAVFKHPFTGDTIPIRGQWQVETKGPEDKMQIPNDAILWNSKLQEWTNVVDKKATSKVTFELEFSNWHNGQPMDIYDVLHYVYFISEWGTSLDENDKTVDTEYTPQVAQFVSTLAGIRPIGNSQIEIYVDYWHFDESEIADWAADVWTKMPWEIYAAMEKSVIDGKASFSRSNAVGKNVNWLSLIVPNDSSMIKNQLQEFNKNEWIPDSLKKFDVSKNYVQTRYDSTISWIDEKNHAVISNGPFYLESYSPESRTITIKAFDDITYPFEKGQWSEFENTEFPQITNVKMPKILSNDDKLEIEIETQNTSEIKYFVTNSQGIVETNSVKTVSNKAILDIAEENLNQETNNVKIFAISEKVLRPDFYSSSFIVSENPIQVEISTDKTKIAKDSESNYIVVVIATIVIIIGAAVYFRRRSK